MTISLANKLSRVVACVAALLWLFATAGQAVELDLVKVKGGAASGNELRIVEIEFKGQTACLRGTDGNGSPM